MNKTENKKAEVKARTIRTIETIRKKSRSVEDNKKEVR